jgi:NAD-reducing hydrogenase small subunit
MSFLDIDERLLELIQIVELDKSPFDDIKEFSAPCDVGFIEGGCSNDENVRVLRSFRKNCRILVSVGECALMGGVPALRNMIPLSECMEEAFLKGPSVVDGVLPDDPELPLILDRVYPSHEVVKIDHFLPGCPPSADAIWELLGALLAGRDIDLGYRMITYD